MSNLIGLSDQLFFLFEQATGTSALLQGVWVYDHPIDPEGLRRFHLHLQRGRLSRCIERSPLPFGRHRWVLPDGQSGPEIVAPPRPRQEFDAWLDVAAATALDLERGPGWHLAVLPFTDGGAGVSMVISHCLTDGVGLCEALADAASGRDSSRDWPGAGSRPRWRALREDARQTAREIPAISRAGIAAARFAQRGRDRGRGRGRAESAAPRAAKPAFAGTDERLTVPMATVFVDAAQWDARADALGGSGNALLAGLSARVAQRMGRVTSDGTVTLTMPVNERTGDDDRANAVVNVNITIDPDAATTDLSEIRAAAKKALVRRTDVADSQLTMLPLAPLVPRRLLGRMVGLASGSNHRVDSSNLGEINPAAYRVDGTAADRFAIRSLVRETTTAIMHRAGGMLTLFSGRAQRDVFVSVLAYQPGGHNSNEDVRRDLSSALSDFSLTATVGWGCAEPVGGAQ